MTGMNDFEITQLKSKGLIITIRGKSVNVRDQKHRLSPFKHTTIMDHTLEKFKS